jgi:hypothetical protein
MTPQTYSEIKKVLNNMLKTYKAKHDKNIVLKVICPRYKIILSHIIYIYTHWS